jgi:glycosidase
LALPGAVFLYQGDEIGMVDGDGAEPPYDRAGRDAHRHPMQWEPEPLGGFTDGEPWLGLTDPEQRCVARQRGAEGSSYELYRRLIRRRRELTGPVEAKATREGLVLERSGQTIKLGLPYATAG